MSIFEKLSLLFTGNMSSNELQIRQLKREILKDSPKYYNPKKQYFLKTFGKDIGFLAKELTYFYNPLSHLFSTRGAKEVIVKTFLTEFLDKDTLSYFNFCEEENIAKVINKYGIAKSIAYYEKIFSILNKNINTALCGDIDRIIADFKSFFDIVEFNYNNILSLFDPQLLNNTDPRYSPMMKDIKVTVKLKEYFSDLAFLIYNFNPSENFDIYLQKYLVRYYQLQTQKFSPNIFRKKMKNIREILTIRLNSAKMENYLKVLNDDAEYKIKIINYKEELTGKVVQDKINKTQNTLNRAKTEAKAKNLDKYINILFQNIDLIQSNYYNESTSTVFSSIDLKPLSYSKVFSIVKTFIIVYYEGKFKNYLSTLIFKGVFADDNMNLGFNNSFHQANEFLDKINKFEENAGILEKTYNQILKKPETFSKNKHLVSIANAEIDRVNLEAQKIILEVQELLNYLNNMLIEVSNDYEKKKNDKIKNLLTQFEPGFIKELGKFSKAISLLLQIVNELFGS